MPEESFLKTPVFKAMIFAVVLLFLWRVWDVAALVILALAIASALSGPVEYLEKKSWPRLLAVTVLYLAFVLIIAAVLVLLVPSLWRQLFEISQNLPELYSRFLVSFKVLDQLGIQENILPQVKNFFSGSPDQLLGSVVGIARGFASGIVVVVLSFYLLARRDGIEDFLRMLVSEKHEAYVLHLWSRTNRKLGRWLQGQFLLGVIIGIVVFIGLKIAGVPFALALAIWGGFLELVPFIGPIISAVPAVIYGFLQSPAFGLLMVAFYFFIQQLENHFIVPSVMRKTTGLNPIIIIVALIVGGKLGGILGFLVAIPVTVALAEMLDDWAAYKKGMGERV